MKKLVLTFITEYIRYLLEIININKIMEEIKNEK